MRQAAIAKIRKIPRLLKTPRQTAATLLERFNGVTPQQTADRHLARYAATSEIDKFIGTLPHSEMSAVEISGDYLIRRNEWALRQTLHFPEFDLCNPAYIPGQYDVVFCSEVLEHVTEPWEAIMTLAKLAKPNGYVIVTVPFMLPYHPAPIDAWRFSEVGLSILMKKAGLHIVKTGSWGNAQSVRANMYVWATRRPWHSKRNDPRFPINVWAIGRRVEQ
jgi:hypothetical protein